MKKNLLLLLSLIVIGTTLGYAGPVDRSMAEKVAMTFCLTNHNLKSLAPSSLSLAYTEKTMILNEENSKSSQAIPVFYIFNLDGNKGFIMVSADDEVSPVLGYSTSGSFTGTDIPAPFQKLMEFYKDQIRYVLVNQLEADQETEAEWMNLENGNPMRSSKNSTAVSPLLNTTWSQSPYENQMCPADPAGPGGHCVTGCPATAMAQIMKFWNHPTTGTGFHSYNASNQNGNYGTLSADFGSTTYDWASMPNHMTSISNSVSLIMFHCGVAVEMDYGPNGSGGWVIENDQNGSHPVCSEVAYKTYFGYASSLQGLRKSGYSDDQWKQMIRTDLDASRPIQYAGWGSGGHTFVCDGYDQNENFHINWGWGGTYDGYFTLDALNPGTSNFSVNQQAVFGIQPAQGGGGTTTLDLYSAITVSPNPINYGDGFTVNADVVNNGSSTFQGDFCAVLFTSEGNQVDFIQILTGANLPSGYHYTGGLDFTTAGIASATPGSYIVGIYSRPTGGNWTALGDGSYNNHINVTVQGTANNISLYDALVVSQNPIMINQPFTATTDIANMGSSTFNGDLSLDLHASNGEWIQVIQEYPDQTLQAGYYFDDVVFSCAGLDVEPGDYYIVVWDRPDGGEWEIVSASSYTNPLSVVISGQPLSADSYEPNNNETNPRILQVNFSGNTAGVNTNGSNINSSDDLDYFKLDLPGGYSYTINARVHDSYNSGNGQTYTGDVMFAYKMGSKWSDAYDDVMPSNIIMNGGGALIFNVFPYFPGQTGSYLLDMTITRNYTGIENTKDIGSMNVFPNPANDLATFRFELQKSEAVTGILTNVFGQTVMEITNESFTAGIHNLRIDVSKLPAGCYLYEFVSESGKTKGKLVVTK